MAMISLEYEGDEYVEYNPSKYGYGAEITLNGEQCEKLGITSAKAGQPVSIRAVGVITRASEELEASTDSGGKDISICVQLTDMSLEMTGSANPRAASKKLYGD